MNVLLSAVLWSRISHQGRENKKVVFKEEKRKNDPLVKDIDECIIYNLKCCGAELAIKEEKTIKVVFEEEKRKNDCLEIDECIIICS